MTTARNTWQAVRADTDERVSYPYYVASAAYKIAAREANRLGVEIVVTRNGVPYRSFKPEP